MRALALATAALLLPAALGAQATMVAPPDSAAADLVIARARRAATEGNTGEARRVLDSLVRVADPQAARLPDALFWRATYAATAADAERDYRRLVVEHPASPRVEDALLRLAQLELVRGDQQMAVRHLDRLVLEHPDSPNRARARYWTGRAWVDAGDTPKACVAFGEALASSAASDTALRNQVRFAGSRCPKGWDAAPAVPAVPAVPAAVATVASPAPPAPTDTARWEGFADSSRAASPVRAATPPVVAAVDTPRVAPVVTPPAATPPADTPPAATRPAATPRVRTVYSVQLAAYDTRADAESLVRRLTTREIAARVTGDAKPFRVRAGSFPTRAQAAQYMAQLKAKGISGFIAEEQATP